MHYMQLDQVAEIDLVTGHACNCHANTQQEHVQAVYQQTDTKSMSPTRSFINLLLAHNWKSNCM